MIHSLAKTYGISPREAEKLTEFDYYNMVGNENLNIERENYLIKNKK